MKLIGADPHINVVLEEVIRRRQSGEELPDTAVLSAHPGLRHELAMRLMILRRIEQAECRAKSAGGGSDSDSMPGSMPSWLSESLSGYTIAGESYRGGQGAVYRATQSTTGRDVAIKVVRGGAFPGRNDDVRFRREIQILGRLKHPNIVPIHDGGVVGECRYFVMDFVVGEPLDCYVATHLQTIVGIVQLFLKICEAVHAAHVRGVIHRDLKPSNIRVDPHGVPYILDFGLAKMSSQEASLNQQVTMTGEFVGSLPWASPEQATGAPDLVDLRSDIYSLGIMLFQLLTGQFPYSVIGPMHQVLSNIAEVEPARPRTLRPDIDADLQVIILTCLEKDPERRYQSAASLKEDLRRFLRHEPIVARAPSTIYRFRKLIHRHKLPAALLTTLSLTIIGFAVAMSISYGRAAASRDRAQLAESLAEQRRVKAEQEAGASRAIKEFLVQDLLSSAKPEVALGREITIEDVLARSAERIEAAFEDQPEIEASIRSTLGQVYWSLGKYQNAEAQFLAATKLLEDTRGPFDLETLNVRHVWISVGLMCGPDWRGLEKSKEFLLDCEGALGEGHELTLKALANYSTALLIMGRNTEALQTLEVALERTRRALGESHSLAIRLYNEWTQLTLDLPGRRPELEPMLRVAMQSARDSLGDDHPETFHAMTNLGYILFSQRRFKEAEPFVRQGYEGLRRVLGETNPRLLFAMRNLILLYREKNQVQEAVALSRRAVSITRQTVGEDNTMTLEAMHFLGTSLFRGGCFCEAEEVVRSSWEAYRRTQGDQSIKTAHALEIYSLALLNLGRPAQAEEGFRRADLARQESEGNSDAWCLRQLIRSLAEQGRAEEARPFGKKLLELRRAPALLPDADAYALNCYAYDLLMVMPEDLSDPSEAMRIAERAFERSSDEYHFNRYTLAMAYEANGHLERAIEFARLALAASPLEYSTERSDYESLLAGFLERAGDPEGAEQVYRDTLNARRTQSPSNQQDVAVTLFDLGTILSRHGKHAEAELQLRECLELQQDLLAEPTEVGCPLTLECDVARTMVAIGEDLLEQERFAEAESHFEGARDWLSRTGRCHEYILFGIDQALHRLYALTGRSDSAARNSHSLH